MNGKAEQPVTSNARYCRALFWVRIRGRACPVFPLRSGVYLVAALACVAVAVLCAEYAMTGLERAGRIATEGWALENYHIDSMNYRKVLNSEQDPVWRSRAMPFKDAPPGCKRILVLGDSFVWGSGNTNANEIWWRQLQRELNRRGYWKVDVVAAGTNGASTQRQFQWLRDTDLLSRVSPDLIILGYVTNDADMTDENGNSYVRQFGGTAALHSKPLGKFLGKMAPRVTYLIQDRLANKRLERSPASWGYPYGQWELKILDGPNFEAYGRMVRDLGEFVKARGIPFFVMTLPNSPNREHFAPRYARVRPLFEAAGLGFHDILDDFINTYSTKINELEWAVNPANGHPGPISTHFFAQKAAIILERDYAELLGPRGETPASLKPTINDWMPPGLDVTRIAPDRWEFEYPMDPPMSLKLSGGVGQEHVVLSFEVPVSARRIMLSSDELIAAEVFIGAVDADKGYDPGDLHGLGVKEGPLAAWDIQSARFARTISTVRITARFDTGRLKHQRIRLAPAAIGKHGFGFCYAYSCEELADGASDAQWVLKEDGKVLGPAGARANQIQRTGGGRWMHDGTELLFSSSDDTDPRTNGYRYELVRWKTRPKLSLRFVFDEKGAVRP